MSSMGNNGNNLDLMLSVRHEPKHDEITGHAWLTMVRFIESLDHKPISEDNLHGSHGAPPKSSPNTDFSRGI